jgi:hypothetical protein
MRLALAVKRIVGRARAFSYNRIQMRKEMAANRYSLAKKSQRLFQEGNVIKDVGDRQR